MGGVEKAGNDDSGDTGVAANGAGRSDDDVAQSSGRVRRELCLVEIPFQSAGRDDRISGADRQQAESRLETVFSEDVATGMEHIDAICSNPGAQAVEGAQVRMGKRRDDSENVVDAISTAPHHGDVAVTGSDCMGQGELRVGEVLVPRMFDDGAAQ